MESKDISLLLIIEPKEPYIRPRMDIESIMKDIKGVGIRNPIVVTKTDKQRKYRIIDGNRRYLACKKLGYTNIPCLVRQ